LLNLTFPVTFRVTKKKVTKKSSASAAAAVSGVVLAVQTPDAEITAASMELSYVAPGVPSLEDSESLLDSGEPASSPTDDDMAIEEKPKKKRTKKRSKPDCTCSTLSFLSSHLNIFSFLFRLLDDDSEVARVRLTRDDLLKVTSEELENFAATAASERPLTVEENREIKRQRRLIKNREYAQMSRGKKKVYMQELESKFNDIENENFELKSQNDQLTHRIAELEQENAQLHDRLAYYECTHSLLPPSPLFLIDSFSFQLPFLQSVLLALICLQLPSFPSKTRSLLFQWM